jgi:hypothetical protein
VAIKDLAPSPVAEGGGAPGGVDDVGEEHGREDAIRFGFGRSAGEELAEHSDRSFDVLAHHA